MSYRRSKHLVAMQMKNLIKTTPLPPPPLNTRRTPVQTHDQRRGASFRELAVGSQPRLIFKYKPPLSVFFFFPRPAHVLNEVKVSVTLTVHELVLQPPCGAYVVKQHRDLGELFKLIPLFKKKNKKTFGKCLKPPVVCLCLWLFCLFFCLT